MKPKVKLHLEQLRLTVNELVQRYPVTLSTLKAFHIDACCNGNLALDRAAERAGVNLEVLLWALETAIAGDTQR